MCLLPSPPPVHANATKTFSFLGTGAQPPVVSKKREGATLNLAAALGLLHSTPPTPALVGSCFALYGYHGGLRHGGAHSLVGSGR